ncbi:hypothetical protein [Nitratireductor sp. StC3]|uniref:hypothetical protein n=1 Tax=Nitratireductor sp. StC3 TaxID=2126741 RepID=UPI000D0D5970|nr:hypothetical protein [Nitratireductor sp. StC3]PSM20211.1 hypothetical protein C7T96_03970 [Nitratireductor sp. StC3]
MTKPLRFTKSEIANAARIAREYGVAIKLDADGSIIIYPDARAAKAASNSTTDKATSAFEKWKAQRDADPARGGRPR